MSATPLSETSEEARSNQTPPALRKWVREEFEGVSLFRRYTDHDNPRPAGWEILADCAILRGVPDGFTVVRASGWKDEQVYVQIRED